LLIHAFETADAQQKGELNILISENASDKVERVLKIFRDCNVDDWAKQLKQEYLNKALYHLDEIAVLSVRKKPLLELANFLIQREH